jgi:hypothetical protein
VLACWKNGALVTPRHAGVAIGLLVDVRDTPREVQVIAREKGMIPYIPADDA